MHSPIAFSFPISPLHSPAIVAEMQRNSSGAPREHLRANRNIRALREQIPRAVSSLRLSPYLVFTRDVRFAKLRYKTAREILKSIPTEVERHFRREICNFLEVFSLLPRSATIRSAVQRRGKPVRRKQIDFYHRASCESPYIFRRVTRDFSRVSARSAKLARLSRSLQLCKYLRVRD